LAASLFGSILALVTAASGSWQAGVRVEVRGVAGAPDARVYSPYEVDPYVSYLLDVRPDLALRAAYTPRFILDSTNTGEYGISGISQYHQLQLGLGWLMAPKLRLSLVANGSVGFLEITPGTQLAPPTSASGGPATPTPGLPPTPPQSLNPVAGIRAASYSSASATSGLDWYTSTDVTLGGSAGVTYSGGLDAPAQLVYPLQYGWNGELRTAFTASPVHKITARANASQNFFPNVSTATVAALSGRWDVTMSSTLFGHVTAGGSLSRDVYVSQDGSSPWRPLPILEVGIQQTAPMYGRGIGFSVLLGYGPTIDPFNNQVLQQTQLSIDLSWRPSAQLGFTASAASAAVLSGGSLGPRVVAANLGSWYHQRELDFGLILGAGWQQQTDQTVAPWQWTVSVAVNWYGKDRL
jgi:hypothetical protein